MFNDILFYISFMKKQRLYDQEQHIPISKFKLKVLWNTGTISGTIYFLIQKKKKIIERKFFTYYVDKLPANSRSPSLMKK